MVVFGPLMPCQMALWPAARFITVFGKRAGSTWYGRSPTRESRVKSMMLCTLPEPVPSTSPVSSGREVSSGPPSASNSPTAVTAMAVTRSMVRVPLRPMCSVTSKSGTSAPSVNGPGWVP